MGNCPFACLSTNSLVHTSGDHETVKVVRLSDGRVFEYDGPVCVKDLLFGFEDLAVFHSSSTNRPLCAETELEFGHLYYVKPWQPLENMDSSGRVEANTVSGKLENDVKKQKRARRVRFLLDDEFTSKLVAPEPFQFTVPEIDSKTEFCDQKQSGIFRIKLMISKKDLEEILSIEENADALVEKLLARLLTRKEAADLDAQRSPRSWKPSLASIPEAQSARHLC